MPLLAALYPLVTPKELGLPRVGMFSEMGLPDHSFIGNSLRLEGKKRIGAIGKPRFFYVPKLLVTLL